MKYIPGFIVTFLNVCIQSRRRIKRNGVLILLIIFSIVLSSIQAQNLNCKLVMCVDLEGKNVAVVSGDNNVEIADQQFLAGKCPEVTSITTCPIECDGPYAKSGAYWPWKKCTGSAGQYVCPNGPKSVRKLCPQGQDPSFPLGLSIIPGNSTCNLVMCVEPGGTNAAITSGDNSNFAKNGQSFLSTKCPEVSNITTCSVDCTGPYSQTGAYWTWKKCTGNGGQFECSPSVLKVCPFGLDQNYPFSPTTSSGNTTKTQSGKKNDGGGSGSGGNGGNGGNVIIYKSQSTKQTVTMSFLFGDLLLVTLILLIQFS